MLKDKRILITGGRGFLGRAVVNQLHRLGCHIITEWNGGIATDPGVYTFRSQDYDLVRQADAEQIMLEVEPDILIHLAAVCGGIGANRERPAEFYYKNVMMGTNIIEAAKESRVGKTVIIGTICSYPKHATIPFKEDQIWDGYPEETNAPYGIAKKALLVQAQAYRQQYGTNIIYMLPVNLYGPNDNFDPNTSHVIPAMIRKFQNAKTSRQRSVTMWGTGSATREFLYVDDAAEAIIMASERYDSPEPVNIGAGFEISIKDLADLITREIDYEGEILWDTTKPDGQPRRSLDTTRAAQFGFKAKVELSQGIRSTIEWYKKQCTQT